MAELSGKEKDRVSHRGRALRRARRLFEADVALSDRAQAPPRSRLVRKESPTNVPMALPTLERKNTAST